ncbi:MULTISPECIES: hypothetical protein [unclassified Bradyrhizobium]|uniref:hypothetical protein n=1 Tax=unclassified Bradyrhizobium TaxID=2631580 RepID=UPI0029166B6F|nr:MULTISPECIES: hypothetical protein [unclassified Bradyrhizobium]
MSIAVSNRILVSIERSPASDPSRIGRAADAAVQHRAFNTEQMAATSRTHGDRRQVNPEDIIEMLRHAEVW